MDLIIQKRPGILPGRFHSDGEGPQEISFRALLPLPEMTSEADVISFWRYDHRAGILPP